MPRTIPPELVSAVQQAVRPKRLLNTAVELIAIPSPTRSAGAVADRLSEILAADGFTVERPAAGWPDAPAVVVRYAPGGSGRTLQFDGHLDTVHLPFVAPRVADGVLYGSGASDMKGGVAAMVEALQVVRDLGGPAGGGILFTAHDLHESPWGDGSQLNGLIDDGYVGDGCLIAEYLVDRLPIVGRGSAILEIVVRREGIPLHEVVGGIDQPSVIAAGAEIVRQFGQLDLKIAKNVHPMAGRESVFIGQIHGGEIYNQSPIELRISGTRRWLAGADVQRVEQEYRGILAEVAEGSGTTIEGKFTLVRPAFELDQSDVLVDVFQAACQATMGRTLPVGPKPFVDDGNTVGTRAGVAAITHGPGGKGAHTIDESVPLDELTRVAALYALAALEYCPLGD
jgi:acetylornithine deacetylase/succinyl-diaminopimelate desuccinylase-like protein